MDSVKKSVYTQIQMRVGQRFSETHEDGRFDWFEFHLIQWDNEASP